MSERISGSGDEKIIIIQASDAPKSFVRGKKAFVTNQSQTLKGAGENVLILSTIFPFNIKGRQVDIVDCFSQPTKQVLYAQDTSEILNSV